MRVPLHADSSANPSRRRTIICRFYFHAAVQMHGAFAELVITEGLDWQRQQGRPLFSEHGCDLTLGGAVDARVGPARLPMIQIRLRLLHAFETHALQWRLLRVADSTL